MNMLITMLLPILIAVESHGNDLAVGDKGRAVGCLQITQACVDDVNRIYHTDYTHEDCRSRARSMEIGTRYLKHWGRHYEAVTGRYATIEVLARIWNGGPNGWKNPTTLPYWNKVQDENKRVNRSKGSVHGH